MKTMALFLVFYSFCTTVFGQTDTIIVKGNKFIAITKTEKNEFNGKDTLLKFCRIENNTAKGLLTHYTYRYSADCNNEFTDIGTYSVQNDSILFLTEYLQKTGIDPIPERRKQIYKVGNKGKLTLIYDRELSRSGEWIDSNNK